MHLTIQIVSLSFARPITCACVTKIYSNVISVIYCDDRVVCMHLAIFPKLCRFLAIKNTLSVQLYNRFKVSNIKLAVISLPLFCSSFNAL